jgi:periplasmic copper chaperone A
MKRIASVVAVLAFLLTSVVGIHAVAQQGSGMGMGTPMAGEAQGMSMGAFYLTITNSGDEADRLLSVTTEVATTVEIHDVVMDGGVMQMMPQFDGVEIPAGGELVLEPGSYHVMLIGLTQSLLDGDSFEATLTFENAGDVTVTVPVRMSAPDAGELEAEPVEAGELVLDGIWARQAPMLEGTGGMGTP